MKTFLALTTMGIVSATAAGALIGASMLGSRQAKATPSFSQQTGLPCGQCHDDPAGGGKLKTFGEEFRANGNKIPRK
jgi:hypothetical protein